MINSVLSSLIKQESYKNYKKTWQEIFLYYILLIYSLCVMNLSL